MKFLTGLIIANMWLIAAISLPSFIAFFVGMAWLIGAAIVNEK